MLRHTVMISALSIVAPAASAQMGNPAFWGADTRTEKPGVISPRQTNNTDRLFTQLLAAGGRAEMEFSKLAQERGRAPGVREFAEAMLKAHQKSDENLKELARASNIPLPDHLTPDQEKTREVLAGLSDRPFDLAYIRSQITEHQKTAQLLIWEAGSGEHGKLQVMAAQLLPDVLEHLRRAQILRAELTSTVAR